MLNPKDIVGINLSYPYDIMKLCRMWNMTVNIYASIGSLLVVLTFQHIRGKEIIKQNIP